jgi:heme oxygenase (biliverdin-IX-beta and delta-forming)
MILQELREHTQLQHRALEKLVRPCLGFDGASASQQNYRVLMQRFWGFYAPLEETLWARDWNFENYRAAERRKTPLLQRDLSALGSAPHEQKTLVRCADLPALNSRAQVLGCFYVLEGATLGGQIIARHLRKTLDIGPENGGAFFASYGENIGPMWQNFRVLITSQVIHEKDCRLAIDTAQQTFETFHAWLRAGS